MATSGTVGQTRLSVRQIIDHAIRRCKKTPQEVGAEELVTAKELLHFRLSELVNGVTPLWLIRPVVLPIYAGEPEVQCPEGVYDVISVNLRHVQYLDGDLSSSEGFADDAFDQEVETACGQVTPDGYIQITLDDAQKLSVAGVLPAADGTWSYEVQGSDDGVSFTTLLAVEEQEVVDGEWQWYSLTPSRSYERYRLQATGGTVLDVRELALGNNPRDIPLGILNRDSYFDMPNKTFDSRPTSYWLDRQSERQVIHLWPAPAAHYTFSQIVAQAQYHIQDVGTLTDELEIPQRWRMAVVAMLASDLIRELRDVDVSLIPILDADRDREMMRVQNGESDRAPTRLMPRIGVYTR